MKCQSCEKDHDGSYASGRFCNVQCARSFSSKEKREQINEAVSQKLSIAKVCKSCGLTFLGKESKSKIHCLSCKKPNYAGLAFESLKTDASRKSRLLKERGHRCENAICGLTEWRGQPVPIELDHIDGNSDNNAKENVRLLCANCHSQTSTHAGRNVGRFKTKRMHEMLKYRRYAPRDS